MANKLMVQAWGEQMETLKKLAKNLEQILDMVVNKNFIKPLIKEERNS